MSKLFVTNGRPIKIHVETDDFVRLLKTTKLILKNGGLAVSTPDAETVTLVDPSATYSSNGYANFGIEWLTDSTAKGTLLDIRRYLLTSSKPSCNELNVDPSSYQQSQSPIHVSHSSDILLSQSSPSLSDGRLDDVTLRKRNPRATLSESSVKTLDKQLSAELPSSDSGEREANDEASNIKKRVNKSKKKRVRKEKAHNSRKQDTSHGPRGASLGQDDNSSIKTSRGTRSLGKPANKHRRSLKIINRKSSLSPSKTCQEQKRDDVHSGIQKNATPKQIICMEDEEKEAEKYSTLWDCMDGNNWSQVENGCWRPAGFDEIFLVELDHSSSPQLILDETHNSLILDFNESDTHCEPKLQSRRKRRHTVK